MKKTINRVKPAPWIQDFVHTIRGKIYIIHLLQTPFGKMSTGWVGLFWYQIRDGNATQKLVYEEGIRCTVF